MNKNDNPKDFHWGKGEIIDAIITSMFFVGMFVLSRVAEIPT